MRRRAPVGRGPPKASGHSGKLSADPDGTNRICRSPLVTGKRLALPQVAVRFAMP